MRPRDLSKLIVPQFSASSAIMGSGTSFEDYSEIPGVNYSSIKFLDPDLGCPLQTAWNLRFSSEKKSKALEFGSSFHALALDPSEWLSRYVSLDDETANKLYAQQREEGLEKKSKAAYMRYETYSDYIQSGGSVNRMAVFKAWKAGIEAEGKRVIDPPERKELENMAHSLDDNPEVRDALQQCSSENREVSIASAMKVKGGFLRVKGRLDLLSDDSTKILDLKTCRSAHPDTFSDQIARLGYATQAAFYVLLGQSLDLPVGKFSWVSIEKSAPYVCTIHTLPADWLRLGMQEAKKMVCECAHRIKTDDWPGYPPSEVTPPTWIQNTIMELGI